MSYKPVPKQDIDWVPLDTWYSEDKQAERLGPFSVEGKKASSNEYYVAMALEKLQLEYTFQVSYYGGRRLRGGLVLDFLVYTVPIPTPLWVHGNYWHGGKRAVIDKLQAATIFMQMRGDVSQPVIIWGDESNSIEEALQAVRRELNL
jgi:hypothetical protein